MPYARNADLPERVRNAYGADGQEAYRKAFNAAYAGTCRGGGRQGNREGCSHAVATSAAKRTEAMSKAAEFFKALFVHAGPKVVLEVEDAPGGIVYTEMPGEVQIAKAGIVVKADDEKQILYVPVLVPEVEDSQGDIVSVEEVEKAQAEFAREYSLGDAELGLDHESVLDRDSAYIVEHWIEKQDVSYGEQAVPLGTWMMGIKVLDSEVWESAKAGERTGASIEGTGVRIPL